MIGKRRNSSRFFFKKLEADGVDPEVVEPQKIEDNV